MIIFEEVYFNNSHVLFKLYQFMLQNPDKFYVANGDIG